MKTTGLPAWPEWATIAALTASEEAPIREQLDALKIDRSATASRGGRRWIWVFVAMALLAGGTMAFFWWSMRQAAAGGGPGSAAADGSVAGGAATGAGGSASGNAAGSTAGTTTASGTAALDVTVLNASGYVTARRRATISAEITGRLTEVHVEEGMPVTAGQVLARLDDALFQANLKLAESRLVAARRAVAETVSRRQLAELTLKRTARLLEEGVVGQADYDEADTQQEALVAREALEREQVAVAQSEVALRKAELADTVVRAPYDGIVISKDAQEGEMVSPVSAGGGFTRTGICTIVDMGSLEIEVEVNEAYIARVQAGQTVEAMLDAYPEWSIPGHVITTIPAADRQKATVMVRIAFDELDPRILPDMGVKVAFRRE